MDQWSQAGQALGLYALLLAMTVYLSVGIAIGLGRLQTELPSPLGRIATHWRTRYPPTLGSATVGSILLVFFNLTPALLAVLPSDGISVPTRIVSLALIGVEIAWFRYLRRFR